MKRAALVAAVAVLLSGAGLGAMTRSGGIGHFPGTPVRAHVVLGPVLVLAHPVHPLEEAATPVAVAARARYGALDALARVRTEPLPGGAGGGLVSAVAIRWR
ncbi:hypothetical protein [Amaricoccus sp.]|uniref:hypothetical protein n=1 Tax=Amaricoccus sp. TaxID=1872485 RepID=UPI001B62AB2C|nr:hypothetical protein [Amaricoccus sp.]MBP7242863.1 hypothetical protein [Amaricoccus sp.]